MSVVRLLASCFGGAGLSNCICQLALTLQPTWRKVSTNPIVRCTNGDIFSILVSRLEDLIQRGVESVINYVIDSINSALNAILGWTRIFGANPRIDHVCWPTDLDPERLDCKGQLPPDQQITLRDCEREKDGLDKMCYYARVSASPLLATTNACTTFGLRARR